MPENSNFWLLRGHRFGQKFEFTVMAPNHGGETLGSILGPMGSRWGKKMGQNRKKFTMSQNSNFWLLRGHRFGQKIEFTLMAPNHGGDTLGSISGPMGSNWGKKMGQNRKNITMPQNSNFRLLRGDRFGQNIEFTVMAPNHGGDSLGSILGQWGPIGAKKWVKTVKNYHAPKFDFLTTQQSSIWAKNRIYGYGPKSRLGPLGSILGPMGSHLGQKMGQKRKKLPCPKIRIFDYSAVIDLGKKSNLQLWRLITVGIP